MSELLNDIKKVKFGKVERYSFGKKPSCLENIDLLELPKKSYKKFLDEGIGECLRDFSIFTNTIFEKSSTDLRKWFTAIKCMLNGKKGISALQLQREIDVTYKTAWRMLRQIRNAMGNTENEKIFTAIVEIDETYVGGKPRKQSKQAKDKSSKDKDDKNKRGRGTSKTPVIGLKERNSSKVYAR